MQQIIFLSALDLLAFLKCVFLLFSLDLYNVFKKLCSTKVNVNYVESSIDIF